ncbi:MAG TPA: outer membrane protein assembly factor BamD [Verrucomicrobiae bacterium]|nr:outer membrane protein assembly factor BamD [Verrucomicrobiae bacterium]
MFRQLSVVIVLAAVAAPFAQAADKVELRIQELQRDVASLQDMVKQLQQSQDQKLAALQTIVQQALDQANRANQSIAGIQTNLQQSLRTQEEKVVAPVVGLSTRMDNLSNDLKTTENAVSDLGGQFSKLMARLDDISNAIKVIAAPPVVPPPVLDSGSAPVPGAGQPGATVPGGTQPPTSPAAPSSPPLSSTEMYQNAYNDYKGGNLEFALNEFQGFLKYYPDSSLAPNAQFYIGFIHYSQNNYEAAAGDFDMVIEKYSEKANKNPEARYYKGMSLLKLDRRNEAETEFRDLIAHYPNTQMADQACQRIKEFGKTCPVPRGRGRGASPKKD